jgi:membrane protein
MADRAASLAYFAMLSLFPGLLIAFGLMRLVGGDGAPDEIARFAGDRGASGALTESLRDAVGTARDASPGGAGLVGAVGLLALVYGASRSFTAAGRALDTTGGRRQAPRPLLRRLEDVGWTLVLLLTAIVATVLLVLSSELLHELLELLGLSQAAADVWAVVRYPAAAVLLLFAVGLVRWAAPTGARGRFRLVTWGAVVTVGVWVAASVGYAVYVSEIASYNATYGAFAGAVILLLWFWLGAAALLYGAELDAVRAERAT